MAKYKDISNERHVINSVGYEHFRAVYVAVLCTLPYFFKNIIFVLFLLFMLYKLSLFIREIVRDEDFPCIDRGVLITGCDSGFGHDMVKHCDGLGFTVFAGCLKEKGYGARLLKAHCSKRIHIIPLDVTSNTSVNRALKYVETNLPSKGMWGILNNAGIQLNGEIELMPLSMFEELIRVSMFGPIRVIQTFLPLIRKNKGRFTTITSVYGMYPLPNNATYTTSMRGLETLIDSLRMEMLKFDVKCSIIEAGCFDYATALKSEENVKKRKEAVEKMWQMATEEVQQTYGKQHLLSWIPEEKGAQTAMGDTGPLMTAVTHALTSENPKTRYIVDGTYRRLFDEYAIMARIYSVLPTWLSDIIITNWSGSGFLKK